MIAGSGLCKGECEFCAHVQNELYYFQSVWTGMVVREPLGLASETVMMEDKARDTEGEGESKHERDHGAVFVLYYDSVQYSVLSTRVSLSIQHSNHDLDAHMIFRNTWYLLVQLGNIDFTNIRANTKHLFNNIVLQRSAFLEFP